MFLAFLIFFFFNNKNDNYTLYIAFCILSWEINIDNSSLASPSVIVVTYINDQQIIIDRDEKFLRWTWMNIYTIEKEWKKIIIIKWNSFLNYYFIFRTMIMKLKRQIFDKELSIFKYSRLLRFKYSNIYLSYL